MTDNTKSKPKTSRNFKNLDSVVDVLYQDISHLNSQVANVRAQVERMWRMKGFDEIAAKAEKDDQAANLYRLVANNTEVVSQLVEQKNKEQDPFSNELFYRGLREKDQRDVARRTSHALHLASLRQRKIKECPNKSHTDHHGIRFVDADGNPVEDRCPRSWWVTQSYLAHLNGNGVAFVEQTPLEVYLKGFKKK